MESLWNSDGETVEHLWKKQIWRNHGKPTRWKIADWNNQRRDTMEWYAKPNGRTENATENCRLGKH